MGELIRFPDSQIAPASPPTDSEVLSCFWVQAYMHFRENGEVFSIPNPDYYKDEIKTFVDNELNNPEMMTDAYAIQFYSNVHGVVFLQSPEKIAASNRERITREQAESRQARLSEPVFDFRLMWSRTQELLNNGTIPIIDLDVGETVPAAFVDAVEKEVCKRRNIRLHNEVIGGELNDLQKSWLREARSMLFGDLECEIESSLTLEQANLRAFNSSAYWADLDPASRVGIYEGVLLSGQ